MSYYIALSLLLIFYILYSWYWQATIVMKARFRSSNVVWAAIFLLVGLGAGFFDLPAQGLSLLLASFLVASLLDGQSGFGEKCVVLSGYFKRTLAYSEIAEVKLVKAPADMPLVVAILQTKNRQQYALRFSKKAEAVMAQLRNKLQGGVKIEVESMV